MKKFLSVIFAVLMIFSCLSACNDKSSSKNDGNEIEVMDGMFMENGRPLYKIVVPAKNNKKEMHAADEFNFFFKEATGRMLDVIYDTGLFFTEEDTYLSLGRTSLFKTSGITADNEKLSYSGYIIRTQGNSIFVTGKDSLYADGTLNGVYELLEHFLGYHYYAPEAYKLNHNVINIKLMNFDIENIPDIKKRCLGYGMMRADQTYADRLRVHNYGDDNEYVANVGGHWQQDLMHQYIHDPDKKDWFGEGTTDHPSGVILCYSNMELRKFFAEKVKEYIIADPGEGRILHLGQPDNYQFCNCEKCKKAREERLMNAAGQQIEFVNWIADYLDPWLKENYPGRDFRFSLFSYHFTDAPPVVWDDDAKEYKPFSQDVIPRDNVGIYWAPISQDFSKPITDPTSNNTDYMKFLQGWNALVKGHKEQIYMWNYAVNMRNYFVNYTPFSLNAMAENYKFFYENGIQYIFEQGPCEGTSSSATMEELKMYLQANLMWDTSLDINELTRDFMSFYYGEAADAMMNYYNTINSYCIELGSRDSSFFGGIFADIGAKKYWPKEFVDCLDNLFQKAFESIEPLKTENPERYKVLFERIEKMYITIDYLNLEHYTSLYKPEEIEGMIDRFEKISAKYNMYNFAEGQSVSIKINKWKNSI